MGWLESFILTTTSLPPRVIINNRHIVLRLDASREDGLLFRRNLSRPSAEEELVLPIS